MKKFNFLLMMLASLAFVTTSCSKDDVNPTPDEPTNEGITLALSGGAEDILVFGYDIEKDVIVTASKAAASPIEVTLSLTGDANGNAVLAEQTLTIAKGATTAQTKIKFPLDKFPYGTAQSEISVNAVTSDKVVTFTSAKESYFPYGEDGKIKENNLTITSSATSVSTTLGGKITLTYTLTKKQTADLTITQTIGADAIDASLVSWDKTAFVIKAGEKSTTATVTAQAKAAGKLPLTFAIDNKDVVLKTASMDLEFTYSFPSAPVKLCPLTFDYQNYTITKTFSFGDYTLTPEHTTDGKGYGLIDMTADVTANASEGDLVSILCQNTTSTKGDKYAAVVFVDWDRNGVLTENERLLYKEWTAGENNELDAVRSFDFTAPEGTVDGKYFARLGNYFIKGSTFKNGGCGKTESGDLIDIEINYSKTPSALTASIAASGTTDVTAAGTIKKEFVVRLNRPAKEAQTINLTSSNAKGVLTSSSIVIPVGSNSAKGEISFSESDFPAKSAKEIIKVSISSTSPEIAVGTSFIEYTVKPLPESGVLDTYCVIGGEGYSYASVGGVEVGGKTLRAGDITLYNEYINLSQDVNFIAAITEGENVKITFKNQAAQGSCGAGDTFEAVVYADWNKDGDFADAGERYVQNFVVECEEGGTQDINIKLTDIPADAAQKSTLRILTHFLGKATIDGCQKIESGNAYDVAYNLTK